MSRIKKAIVDERDISLGVICPFRGGASIDLDYYFSQDYTDINQAAREVPALIEWVNAQLQSMYEDKLNLDVELSETIGKTYFDLKSGTYQEIYGLKPTDKGLECAINLNDEVQDIRRRLNIAKGWVRRLNNLQDSLQTKLDLIRSSEATRRRLVEPAELELDREVNRRRRLEDQDRDQEQEKESN